ncbi:uncharacterized protein Tco025E_09256 [Trypanosoma conorhini]|uniref:Aminotransferase class V domain-containing protein n=1 Tax=Trypanosoma conorhini TaxID=83891 RepID=A0A422MYD8_9TRYP|nr:uncharacterized protein Tco025E_09256 [Trypanosoma conorhini]RNE98264.1 hypothetical protein Tco025E_09256 [Trypanosoma conorhini]
MQDDSAPAESSATDKDDVWSIASIPPRFSKLLGALDDAAFTHNISAYEGFGSFHSGNVEELIAVESGAYHPPLLPPFARRVLGRSELCQLLAAKDEEERMEIRKRPIQRCEFGLPFRQEHFTVTPEFVFINHGAFGGTLCGALAIKHGYEELMERQVVEYMDRELLPLVVYSVRRLAEFFNANPQQVVLLQNATFALNCAMQLIAKDDVVAFFDTEYLSVYKMMYFRCESVGATLHEVSLTRHLHDASIMGDDAALTDEICRQLPSGCTTAVFDYVTSTTALCLPVFTHIIPALRKRGVTKIIVDGAHAPLQLHLDFNDLPAASKPSVFVGNLHKWFSIAKSVGFIWVNNSILDSFHSVVLSHGAGDGFLSEFIWDGTRDYGAYLCIPAVIDFWRLQGVERVRDHCAHLLQSAAKMLTSRFGTRPVARHAPFMSLVELPEALQGPYLTAKYIQDLLHDIYMLEVPVKRVEGRFYVRISAFVYNTPGEYVYLREAVLGIARNWLHSELQRRLLPRGAGDPADPSLPCDKRIREQGGCGVSGLEPVVKKRRGTRF